MSDKSKKHFAKKNLDTEISSLLCPRCEPDKGEFVDIIDVEKLQSLIDAFYKLTDIGIGIVDLSGNVLVANGWQDICSKFHRVHSDTLKNCMESDIYLASDVKEGEYRQYKCKNNMWDVVTPIVVGGKHMANLFIGQFFFEDEVSDMGVFGAQAERYGFDKDQYLSALQMVPRWSRKKVDATISFYSKLASTIGQLSYSNLALAKMMIERKQTEDVLRQSEERFSKIFRHAPIMITLSNLDDGTYLAVNDKFVEISGFSREDTIGRTSNELGLILPQDRIKVVEELKTHGRVLDRELKFFCRDKREITCIYNCEILKTSNGSQLLSIGCDNTERIQAQREKDALQSQLIQAQKMEAIGTLAGGIYHDFNNLLQVIVGYSEILLQSKQFDGSDYADLEQIYEAGKRGAELIQGLMTFSRKDDIQTKPIDLGVQIRQFRNILSRTIHKMIRIELIFDPDLALIKADPGQTEQIFMNLAVNARDAMGDKGKITIGAKNTILDETYCNTHVGVNPGPYVLMTFSDTGSGMDKETLSHIFEPFFTTKQEGKGTGLGLATVYGIVKRHNGSIDCESEPGYGTTFKIYFPAIPPEEKVSIDKTPVAPKSGMETILFVDDEEPVRIVSSRMLKSAGYGVLTACNGRQAVDLFKREGGNISLVILDLLMPVMDGQECLEEILRIDPKAKVIIATGVPANNKQIRLAIDSGAKVVVHKPYDMTEMLKMIRDILGKT